MIIKNNNKAVDVLKNNHVCWEVRKNSRLSYVKKTISYGSWSTHKDPQTIPSISWEGGTTVNIKCWVERTNTVREGFVISPVTEKHYLIPSFNYLDCTVNKTGNNADGFTLTIGKYDNSTSDRLLTGSAQYVDDTGRYGITVTVIQTKRDKITVTFNANGGTIADNTSMQEFIISGNTVSFSKYTPVRTGYTFNGWATSSTATSGSTTGNSAAITADTTFYATWKSATLTPVVGDVLYSTNDNKLTLNALTNGKDNTPIAICVIPDVYENFEKGDESEGGVHTARFVSLNYMNYNTPATGSKEAQLMYFGNFGTTIGNVKGGTNSTAYIGGIWNTKQCVKSATNQDKTSDKVENKPDAGYCAPACCCERYSTPGTKSGDWYLPMPGELYQIYANKTAINEKRTALVGSGFNVSSCWSSREYSSYSEYFVNLNDGEIYDYGYKNDDYYVLGFLAVEVSQLVN